MAKRHRRRVVVLESDDDDEEDGRLTARDSAEAASSEQQAQAGVKLTSPRRKFQKVETSQRKLQWPSSQQLTVNRLLEAGRKSSRKNVSHGTLPVEVVRTPAAKTKESSRSRTARAPAKPQDHQQPNLTQDVDYKLWVDKYTPKSVGELVVHTRKVAEVKEWLQGQLLKPYGSQSGSRVLTLTGPAGVGKTAVVHALVNELGIELVEWTTPVPELWEEYSHHSASGGLYVSKLDEFEAFLGRGRKMSSLPIIQVGQYTAQKVRPFSGDDSVVSPTNCAKVLLIDDLPIAIDQGHKERLASLLFHLALSLDFPKILVVTEELGSSVRPGERDHQHKDVLEALEKGGAKNIAFNPVTVNAMKKLLSKVQLLENCRLSSESLSDIAKCSAGDIRQALTSLQFLCLGCHAQNLHHLMWDPGGLGSSQFDPRNIHTEETESQETSILHKNSCASVGVGRDFSLPLFHALGKFLHNKRLTDVHSQSGPSVISRLKEEFGRHPLDMEEPELILSQAHADPLTLIAFLHENVLQFIDEEAADDVAAVSAYLSDTDLLLGSLGSFRSRNFFIDANDIDPSQIATVVANSVAARGVLFGNAHPAPRRWQSLRAPAIWQVERQNKLTKIKMSCKDLNGICSTRSHGGLVKAMKLYPFSSHLPWHCSSSAVPNGFAACKIIEGAGSMQRDELNSGAQLPDEQEMPQGHDVLESTLMLMSVEDEDDVEDPGN